MTGRRKEKEKRGKGMKKKGKNRESRGAMRGGEAGALLNGLGH